MCSCGKKRVTEFLVTFSDGTTRTVSSEPAARAEISMKGGGTYKPVRK
jgi:hypothetical protein